MLTNRSPMEHKPKPFSSIPTPTYDKTRIGGFGSDPTFKPKPKIPKYRAGCDWEKCICSTFDSISCYSIFIILIMIIVYVTIGLSIWYGCTVIITGTDYLANSSEEQCLLLSYYETECDYECNCRTRYDVNGDSEYHCDTCTGIDYQYTATSTDKCGDIILYNDDVGDDNECPETLKEINKEYKCWVHECDKREFLLNHPETVITNGIISIVASIAACLVFTWFFCCCGEKVRDWC